MQQADDARITVAEFLTKRIDASDKTQRELAEEIGFECPNMLSMLKSGSAKVPLNRVGAIAVALDIDPVELMHRVMAEYMPETLAAIQEILPGLSRGEREVIQALRRIKGKSNADPVVCDARDVVALVMV